MTVDLEFDEDVPAEEEEHDWRSCRCDDCAQERREQRAEQQGYQL